MENNFFYLPFIFTPYQTGESIVQVKNQITQQQDNQYLNLQKKYIQLKKENRTLKKQNESLKLQIEQLEENQRINKNKRNRRRTQHQINKTFACSFQNCSKLYGSDLALNLHMKFKHNAGTKKQRIQIIKNIVDSEQKDKILGQCDINIPPNEIQQLQRVVSSNRMKQKQFIESSSTQKITI